jgi:peptidoglycan-associated lipoprotein
MMRKLLPLLALCTLGAASAATAQVRMPGVRQQQAPVLTGIDALRADFLARTGSTTIYFGPNSALLSAPSRAVLSAQAAWLRQQPNVVVQVEGYGDSNDSRDHSLAMGARRAEEARNYLVLMGVPAAQISITTWGKARPGAGRAVTMLVR